MKKLIIFSAALLAFCGSVKAETLSEQMSNYEPSKESIVRGQGCDHPFYIALSANWAAVQNAQDGASVLATDSGTGLGAAIGWYEGDARMEFEFAQVSVDADSVGGVGNSTGNIGLDIWMINGYYDVDLGSGLSGYVGAGVGMARVGAHSLQTPGGFVNALSKPEFAYQLRVGTAYEITHRAEIFGGYRFLGTSNIDVGHDNIAGTTVAGVFSDEYHIHGIEMGLRFKL